MFPCFPISAADVVLAWLPVATVLSKIFTWCQSVQMNQFHPCCNLSKVQVGNFTYFISDGLHLDPKDENITYRMLW